MAIKEQGPVEDYIMLKKGIVTDGEKWREWASSGTFHSGTLVDAPRSDARGEF